MTAKPRTKNQLIDEAHRFREFLDHATPRTIALGAFVREFEQQNPTIQTRNLGIALVAAIDALISEAERLADRKSGVL